MRIGIDAGGTFTDFIVLHDDGRLESFKIRSNPVAPHEVILAGIARAAAGGGGKAFEVVHGSTVATNALLERKGVTTALVTTAGFEDLLLIGRQNRRELYNLTPAPETPIIPAQLSFGLKERTLFDGSVETRPTAAALKQLARRIKQSRAESVAICFLHSYANPAHERMAVQALAAALPGCYVCASHEVSPEFREFERASTTAINAYVGPLMDRYLGALEAGLGRKHHVAILQSNGGYLTAREARRHAVRTVLSGPAGGLIAATRMASRAGFPKILGFDMGGTSTDVSLADGGTPRETTEAQVDGFPVRVPMLDIHTVGAGGGSIARVDAGGLLRVGPESAGADPGPACYGTGREPTVTDAHVVLGRIAADQFLGGEMRIHPELAAAAVDRVARTLGLSRVAAAEGIIRVANANMDRAIRAVSVERGYDPREFALVAFGGGGGLHACELAAQLQIATVMVPRYSEGLSALGMLLADCVRDYSAGVLGQTPARIEAAYARLEARARREVKARDAAFARTADLRYAGQSYEINVPWADAARAFHREHQRLYGYANRGRAVEVVTIRVRARVATAQPRLTPLRPSSAAGASGMRKVYLGGRWREAEVVTRAQAGGRGGPLLVVDYGSTTLVPPGWRVRTDRTGNLILDASPSGQK